MFTQHIPEEELDLIYPTNCHIQYSDNASKWAQQGYLSIHDNWINHTILGKAAAIADWFGSEYLTIDDEPALALTNRLNDSGYLVQWSEARCWAYRYEPVYTNPSPVSAEQQAFQGWKKGTVIGMNLYHVQAEQYNEKLRQLQREIEAMSLEELKANEDKMWCVYAKPILAHQLIHPFHIASLFIKGAGVVIPVGRVDQQKTERTMMRILKAYRQELWYLNNYDPFATVNSPDTITEMELAWK